MGIGRQIAGGPKTLEFSPKPGKVRIRRLDDMHMRQRQPSLELLHYARTGIWRAKLYGWS